MCSIDGCQKKAEKRGWCSNHYYRWRTYGDVHHTPKRTWAEERKCVVCGKTPAPGSGRRKHCSAACQQLDSSWRRMNRSRPDAISCGRCGSLINLNERGKAGRLRRADVLLCDRCRQARGKGYAMSVTELAERDGTACGICREQVEMTITEGPKKPSVDHIHPRSLGGSDDADNLRLTHLICNQVRGNKIEEVTTHGD